MEETIERNKRKGNRREGKVRAGIAAARLLFHTREHAYTGKISLAFIVEKCLGCKLLGSGNNRVSRNQSVMIISGEPFEHV